ncbi:MAG: uracil permease [Eubacteriaceae bacterium]|nr:uracil permease [Eubacteriaceae bacterium]
MKNQRIIQVEEKLPLKMMVPLSLQHMFAMFGASVLVPFLFGINPAIVLFMNGVGTLLFMFITKGKAPAYLGSSFAFLAPAGVVIASWGYAYALGGFVVVGLCGCILAGVIYKFGTAWIDVVLPPAAMGPVVALIGLELASTAASTGGIITQTSYVLDEASGLYEQVVTAINPNNVIVFMVTLAFAVFGSVVFKKFLSVIPILIAIVAGYVTALVTGVVGAESFSEVAAAPWFSLPNFQLPQFDISAILIILPVLLVITSEHIGHQIVTGKVIGRDLIKDPGLHRSLFADNFSAGAAIISIICSFVGKLSMLISTIPGAVIGGISFLLYGMIGASGIRILVDSQVDYGKSRNLALTSVVFVVGLSGVSLRFGSIQLTGMVLATVVGMVLSLIFYVLDRLKLTNDADEHLYDQP